MGRAFCDVIKLTNNMGNNNQRIIFLVSEDITPVQIILDVLKKNGISDPTDDFKDTTKTPRLVIVNNAVKDFFDKKLSEKKMSELFENELKVTKETAVGIIKDLKEKIIPFGKKITIPTDGEPIKVPDVVNNVEFPNTKEIITEDSQPPQKNLEQKVGGNMEVSSKNYAAPKTRTKKIPEIKEGIKSSVNQNKGPDNYREPIE